MKNKMKEPYIIPNSSKDELYSRYYVCVKEYYKINDMYVTKSFIINDMVDKYGRSYGTEYSLYGFSIIHDENYLLHNYNCDCDNSQFKFYTGDIEISDGDYLIEIILYK